MSLKIENNLICNISDNINLGNKTISITNEQICLLKTTDKTKKKENLICFFRVVKDNKGVIQLAVEFLGTNEKFFDSAKELKTLKAEYQEQEIEDFGLAYRVAEYILDIIKKSPEARESKIRFGEKPILIKNLKEDPNNPSKSKFDYQNFPPSTDDYLSSEWDEQDKFQSLIDDLDERLGDLKVRFLSIAEGLEPEKNTESKTIDPLDLECPSPSKEETTKSKGLIVGFFSKLFFLLTCGCFRK